jgi:hypothetical protein
VKSMAAKVADETRRNILYSRRRQGDRGDAAGRVRFG